MLDIALLGPIETSIAPAQRGDGERLRIGTDAFLIGYPGFQDQNPQPTFGRGLISLIREWPAVGITLIQTDHSISSGQSGGALVSTEGEVIGISSLGLTDARFSGALSMSDLENAIDDLKNQRVGRLGNRDLRLDNPRNEISFSLSNEWDHATFVLTGEALTTANISVNSENDANFLVTNIFGQALIDFVDALYSGQEQASATFDSTGFIFVDVTQSTPFSGNFTISCNCDIHLQADSDDGIPLPIDFEFAGNLDFRGDADYFTIDLTEGQVIRVSADSGNFDAFAVVSWVGAGFRHLYFDHDSGGGVLGLNPEIFFRAPYTGEFVIWVTDSFDSTQGGYVLTVEEVDTDHPGAIPDPPETVASALGEMQVYEMGSVALQVLLPVPWTRGPPLPEALVEAQFQSDQGAVLLVTIEDLSALSVEPLDLAGYVDIVISAVAEIGITFDERTSGMTTSGVAFERLETSVGGTRAIRYVTVSTDEFGSVGVNLTLSKGPQTQDLSDELIDFIFASLGPIE